MWIEFHPLQHSLLVLLVEIIDVVLSPEDTHRQLKHLNVVQKGFGGCVVTVHSCTNVHGLSSCCDVFDFHRAVFTVLLVEDLRQELE